MARSNHSHYAAADRFERAAARRKRPTERRQATRHAVIRTALAEVAR